MENKKRFLIVLTLSQVKGLVKELEKDKAGIWELEQLTKEQLFLSKRID